MRRWKLTFRGGHRDAAVEREAAADLRSAQIEQQLRARVAELEAEVVRLRRCLTDEVTKTAWLQWMPQRQRQIRSVDPDKTVVVSAREPHAPTEYVPRRHR